MNILELLKYVADQSTLKDITFTSYDLAWSIIYHDSSLYWVLEDDTIGQEIRSHEFILLVEDNIKFSILK